MFDGITALEGYKMTIVLEQVSLASISLFLTTVLLIVYKQIKFLRLSETEYGWRNGWVEQWRDYESNGPAESSWAIVCCSCVKEK